MHPFICKENVCVLFVCVYRCVYRSDDDSNDTHICTCIHCKCPIAERPIDAIAARCSRTMQKHQVRAQGTSHQQSDNAAV